MTYLKTTLIATALTAATSTPVFAGDDMDKDAKVMNETTVTMTAPMTEVRGATTANVGTKANDTIGEVLQANGQPDTQDDYEILTHDGDMMTKSEIKAMDSDGEVADNAIVVPSSSGAITTVSCPIGTTAQPDMTCHVTGNYDLEKSEALRKQEIKSDTQVLGAVSYDKDMSDWEKSEWSSDAETSTTIKYDTKYNGTLRPDTVVVDNLDD